MRIDASKSPDEVPSVSKGQEVTLEIVGKTLEIEILDVCRSARDGRLR